MLEILYWNILIQFYLLGKNWVKNVNLLEFKLKMIG